MIVVTVLPDGLIGWLRNTGIGQLKRRKQLVTYPSLEEDSQVQSERENVGTRD